MSDPVLKKRQYQCQREQVCNRDSSKSDTQKGSQKESYRDEQRQKCLTIPEGSDLHSDNLISGQQANSFI